VHRAAHDRLVDVDIAVPDFQVIAAIRIGTNPGLVVDGSTLTSEIGQGYKVSRVAFLTLGVRNWFHGILLPTENIG
jgi:hypothetical protein